METIGLFDILKMIFVATDEKWSLLSKNEKANSFFMCNRILAAKYPIAAQRLNYNGISTDYALDIWRIHLKKIGSVPPWIYQKSTSEKVKAVKLYLPTKDSLDFYTKSNNVSLKQLKEYQEFFPDDYEKEFKYIDKILKSTPL